MPKSPLPSDIIEIFHTSLLEWSRRNELSAVVAALPLQSGGEIQIRATDEPLITAKRGRKLMPALTSWPSVGMHAKRNPSLACVLEGMADLSFGVTDVMANNARIDSARGIYHVRLKSKNLLVYPSNVPVCDGSRPHWDQAGKPQPDSTILWIDTIAEGVMLHTCHSVPGQHLQGEYRFVLNPRVLPLLETAINELQAGTGSTRTEKATLEIVNSLLHLVFLNIYRSLLEQKSQSVLPVGDVTIRIVAKMPLDSKAEQMKSGAHTVSRCCNYIQSHMGQVLSVEKIARFAFISPAQLNRIFRAELGQSVMEYVNNQRLEQAKKLLINTSLPIGFISESLGFVASPHFNRFFRQRTGMSPGQFRRQAKETKKESFSER